MKAKCMAKRGSIVSISSGYDTLSHFKLLKGNFSGGRSSIVESSPTTSSIFQSPPKATLTINLSKNHSPFVTIQQGGSHSLLLWPLIIPSQTHPFDCFVPMTSFHLSFLQDSSLRMSAMTVRIIVIGDTSVGKTQMMLRYCDNQFSSTRTSTIGVDFKTKTVMIDGVPTGFRSGTLLDKSAFETSSKTITAGPKGSCLSTTSPRRNHSLRSASRFRPSIDSRTPALP
jgi:hypothetical protein